MRLQIRNGLVTGETRGKNRTISFLLLCLAACSDAVAPPVAAELRPISSLQMTGIAGEVVSPSPAVQVKDQRGNPMGGVTVLFAVTSGDGSLSAPGGTTDSLGIATMPRWTLGTKAGANTVTSSIEGLDPVTFTAMGTAGAPASLTKVSGDQQTVIAGSQVPSPPAVLVRDIHGNPVSGVPVVFRAGDNQSVVAGGDQTTDTSGIARVGSWRVGGGSGVYRLDVTAGTLKVSFQATAVSGPPASLIIGSGNNQTGRTGSDLNRHLEVIVRDVNQYPLPGVEVVFEVIAGGGRVMNGIQKTNWEGAAALSQWILGEPGPQAVRATVPGLPPVVFNATATAKVADGPAFNLTDPSGDTSPPTNRQDPPVYDLLEARGEFKADTLIMSWTFSVPVTPRVLSPNPSGLYARIVIDADENPQTGVLGGEYAVFTEGGTSTTAVLSGDAGTQIPASFVGNTFTVRVPLARLAGDDGNLAVTALFNSVDQVVDRFPNEGVVRVTAPTSTR